VSEPASLTDPTPLYRLRDGLYAADLLIVVVTDLNLFTWLDARRRAGQVTDLNDLMAAHGIDARAADVMVTYLVARGLLCRETNGALVPTPLAIDHLVAGSPYDLRSYFGSMRERPTCTALAEVLRNTLNLNGTKISCEVQVCGACTVLIDGAPVSACTYLAYEARGKSVTTIEGLEKPDGTLHPLQQAFIDEFAFQCGFCTPGMIMSAKALLDENPTPTREEIIHHMDGNICRCTGYVPIVAAIQRAAQVIAQESTK